MFSTKVNINTIDKVKRFVFQISHTDVEVDLNHDRYTVDAKSIMGIFSMDISRDLNLYIHTEDKQKIIDVLELIQEFIVE